MKPETREKLSAALKAKWASGTRKKNPPETYIKSADSIRRAIAERGRWDCLSHEICSRGGKTMTEKKLEKLREIGAAKKGKPNPPGPSEKGVGHWKAKFWILRTPDRQLVFGVNLNEIVRSNAHLFTSKELKKKGSGTLASNGLSMLFRIRIYKGKRTVINHWHGWTAVDKAEMVKDIKPPEGKQIMWRPNLD